MSWSKQQFKAFAKDLKATYPGKAWSLLVEEMREAVLAEKVLRIVLSQDLGPSNDKTVEISAIQELRNGIGIEMGLLGLWIDDEHRDESIRLHRARKSKKGGQ